MEQPRTLETLSMLSSGDQKVWVTGFDRHMLEFQCCRLVLAQMVSKVKFGR